MWQEIHRAVLPTLAILLFILCTRVSLTAQHIVKRLQTHYPILWDDFGRPNPDLYLMLGFDVFFVLPRHRPRLTQWFLKRQYLKLNDAEIYRLIGRLKWQMRFIPLLVGLYVLDIILRMYVPR
jgi:hypothetical protein